METIKQAIAKLSQILFGVEVSPEIMRPDERFGDMATNVVMQLMPQLSKIPEGGMRAVAEQLVEALRIELADKLGEVAIAGPGFINFRLNDKTLVEMVGLAPTQSLAGQVVVCEYSDPNPFKILHVGHLYTSVVGDSIANLLQVAGGEVHRVNFGGDVGMHVGKTMWSMLKRLEGENPDKLKDIEPESRTEWMAEAYVEGSNAFEDDEQAKKEIKELNQRIYTLHKENDRTSGFAQIYWTTRQWSYDYFDDFYHLIGTQFERYYAESETIQIGMQKVSENIGDVFEESQGAVIFRGENHGLHNRVFVNSEGLPTYEAKDVGLIFLKDQDYSFDRSVVITGNEQEQYMAVVLKAVEQVDSRLSGATRHITHGLVKLKTTNKAVQKMSSRLGNILRAVDVIDVTSQSLENIRGKSDESTVLAAIKYSFLRPRLGANIAYDPAESVSMEGNSGPYLQYAHARARSIIKKSTTKPTTITNLEPTERTLVRKLGEFSEIIDKAVADLLPSHLCTYLYELSQAFNSFYEKNRVIGDAREETRLTIVDMYANTLKKGLALLGIDAPEKME